MGYTRGNRSLLELARATGNIDAYMAFGARREYRGAIPMKMRIGLIIVSTFLVHCAGTWAYTFFIMLQQGEISFYEPNRPWLMAEFGMAVVWTLVGLFFFGVAIWGIGSK